MHRALPEQRKAGVCGEEPVQRDPQALGRRWGVAMQSQQLLTVCTRHHTSTLSFGLPGLLSTSAPQAPCTSASQCSDSLMGLPTGHTALPAVTALSSQIPPETTMFHSALV